MKYALVIADTEGADLRNSLSDKVVQLLSLEEKLSPFYKEDKGLKHLAIGCYVVPLTSSTSYLEQILYSARKSEIALHVLFLEEEPSWLTSK
jgi:hypothetical protein